ncbi:MAG: hypothetical protein II492_05890 [Eubacterium sp.]|nr:hypothetical protein [Eubacterium sp.]
MFNLFHKKDSSIDKDFFTKYNWLEAGDPESNSYIVPESGNRFRWYNDKNVTDNYYHSGSYELYVGSEGIDYILNNLSEYGMTREAFDRMIRKGAHYHEDNFICLVLNNEETIINGENVLKEVVTTPYYGFYVVVGDDKNLVLLNMKTTNYYVFIPG